MFYPKTIKAIRAKISENFGQTLEAEYHNLDKDKMPCAHELAEYILWMCNKAEAIPKTFSNAVVSDLYIGWILRLVEQDLKLWNNATSQALINEDARAGHDTLPLNT